jgi:outer membrane lipoprotein-sorting protein
MLAACSRPSEPQDRTPQDILRKIEETIENAKTICVKFTYEPTENKQDVGRYSIAMLLKDGNKVRIEEKISFRGLNAGSVIVICDGAKMAALYDPGFSPGEQDAPATFKSGLSTALARGDTLVALAELSPRVGEKEVLDVKTLFQISDIEAGSDDYKAKTLTYRLKIPKLRIVEERNLNVKLWFDPLTYKLIKRTYSVGDKPGFTEVFEEFTLNGELPDERFVLPREKEKPAIDDAAKVVMALKMVADAEVDFRDNDRDNNKVNDYWVGDVSGLYRFLLDGQPIREILIEYSQADAAPLDLSELLPPIKRPVPAHGSFFVALKQYEEKGKAMAYDMGTHRNKSRFGFAAYPTEYPKSGRFTFIMNETGAIYRKDTGGTTPEVFSEEPMKAGWERVP